MLSLGTGESGLDAELCISFPLEKKKRNRKREMEISRIIRNKRVLLDCVPAVSSTEISKYPNIQISKYQNIKIPKQTGASG
jgi:hypothetical protein